MFLNQFQSIINIRIIIIIITIDLKVYAFALFQPKKTKQKHTYIESFYFTLTNSKHSPCTLTVSEGTSAHLSSKRKKETKRVHMQREY